MYDYYALTYQSCNTANTCKHACRPIVYSESLYMLYCKHVYNLFAYIY